MNKNLSWLAGILAVCALLVMRDQGPYPGPREQLPPPELKVVSEGANEILIDLRNQNTYQADPGVPVELLDNHVKGEMLLKLTLDGSPYSRARFHLTYAEGPGEGWTFNLGDSRSNNGHGGDGGTQSRDAEVQIYNGNFAIFGNDFMGDGSHRLRVVKDVLAGGTATIEVANQEVIYAFGDQTADTMASPYLFALDDQDEREGQINRDLYVGLNRVVSGRSRNGHGLTDVRIELLTD